MTDLELLEAAAKAAGYSGEWDAAWYAMCDGENRWDPLRHNGQALRLAVKLGIDVQHFFASRMVEAWKYPHQACGEDYGDDPYAATRRAIVRAAASMSPDLAAGGREGVR